MECQSIKKTVFRFKRFSVVNERSAMKVNTDGVLLGALATVGNDCSRVLDVGTGTGTIALMVAQRLSDVHVKVSPNHIADDGLILEDDKSELAENFECESELDFCKNINRKLKIDAGESINRKLKIDVGDSIKCELKIDAVEIDCDSAEEAAHNFAMSPWADSLEVHNCSLDDFEQILCCGQNNRCNVDGKLCCANPENIVEKSLGYDLIISNPPFFEETLHSPDARKARTRHSDSLSWRDLVDFAAKWLSYGDNSRLSMILPSSQELSVVRYAAENGLFMSRTVHIKSSVKKPVSRSIIEFSRRRTRDCDVRREELSINASCGYTEEYLDAMHDFLLFA